MKAQSVLRLSFPDYATFDNFIPAGNVRGVSILRKMLSDAGRGQTAFLWGAPDTGKTHLLYAACNQIDNSIYVSLADAKVRPDILDSLDEIDLTCVDDLQCIAGDVEWENRLMRLVEEIEAGGKFLLLSSRLSPDALGLALPDLRTRLKGRQVLLLRPIGHEDRIKALSEFAARNGIALDDQVIQYLLNRYPRDMHSLFELLRRVHFASLSSRRRVTIPFLKEVEGIP